MRQRYFPDRATPLRRGLLRLSRGPRTTATSALDDSRGDRRTAARRPPSRRARRLEAEIAIRDARLHWTRNEPEAAERALRRALRWWPDHRRAHRTLAEYLLRLDRLRRRDRRRGRAAELRPDTYEYWHFLGILLRRAGDFAGAAEAQAARSSSTPATPPRGTSSSRC